VQQLQREPRTDAERGPVHGDEPGGQPVRLIDSQPHERDASVLAQPGQPLYHIEFSNDGLITFPGGLPLKNAEGAIIGAIGVSGSSVEDDNEVATAGAESIVLAPAHA